MEKGVSERGARANCLSWQIRLAMSAAPVPILRSADSPPPEKRGEGKLVAWEESVRSPRGGGTAHGEEESKPSSSSPLASPRPDSRSSRADSPTTSLRVARVDGPARPHSSSPGSSSSARGAGVKVWSISETNNPLVDRLINELRRLLRYQQKETAAANAKNKEMNKLLFDRNEYVKVTVASLKKEEAHAAILNDEVRRLKAGAPSDDFESLRRELLRLHDVAIKSEAQSRLKEEESASLWEQLAASQRKLALSEAAAARPSSSAKDDPEGWIRRQLQMEHAGGLSDGKGGPPGPAEETSAEERLTLLAAKLKALLASVGGGSGAAAAQEAEAEELKDAEWYCSALIQAVQASGGKLISGSNTKAVPGKAKAKGDSNKSKSKQGKSKQEEDSDAAVQDKLAMIQGSMSPMQREALLSATNELQQKLDAAREELLAKSKECEEQQRDLAALDSALEDRKSEIGAIEVMMTTLEAKLSEELAASERISASLDQTTASLEQTTADLGAANAHIATLNQDLDGTRGAAARAAELASGTIATHLATIKARESRIFSLEQESARAAAAAAKALAEKTQDMEELDKRTSAIIFERGEHIRQLLKQIDEWEKKMSLWEIIKGYEGENLSLRAELKELRAEHADCCNRLAMLGEDHLFLSLLLAERGKLLDEKAAHALERENHAALAVLHEELIRTLATERVNHANRQQELADDYAAQLKANNDATDAAARKAIAEKCTEVTVQKGLLAMLEADSQQEAVQFKDTIRQREEKIASLEEALQELDALLFYKDTLLTRLQAEVGEFRAIEVERRGRALRDSALLRVQWIDDPNSEIRAPRQRLKVVEDALVKAEARADLWERLAEGFRREVHSPHAIAFEMDATSPEHKAIFTSAVRERLFAQHAVSLVDCRCVTASSLDALHAWGESQGMTDEDEDRALRVVHLSWPALESMVGLQDFIEDLEAAPPSDAAVNPDGSIDEGLLAIDRFERREAELQRRLLVLFGPGRVSLAEIRALDLLRGALHLSTTQLQEALAATGVRGLQFKALVERAAQGVVDEYEVRASAVLARDAGAVLSALDGPGHMLSSQDFFVHCRSLQQELSAAAELRRRYAELKNAYTAAKLQCSLAAAQQTKAAKAKAGQARSLSAGAAGGEEEKETAERDSIAAAAAAAVEAAAAREAEAQQGQRKAMCREALSRELRRLTLRLNDSAPASSASSSSSSSDAVLVRIDENLESIELQLAQFGDDWDRARLIFVKLVRARLQRDLHLRSEGRRLASRMREAEEEARELIDLADAAAAAAALPGAGGAEEQGQGEGAAGGMISRLVYEQQQALAASNERIRTLLDTIYTQRVAELKQLSARMVELEDRIAAIDPSAVDTHVDLQQYPPVVVTAARPAASGASAGEGGASEYEVLSLPALQSELADVRALDLALDRVDQLAGAAQALLLQQTHREALPMLLERLEHLELVDARLLPDHSLLRTRVVWAADAFPELSGPAAAAAAAASAAGGSENHHQQGQQGQQGQEHYHHEHEQGLYHSSPSSSPGAGGQLVKPQSPSGPSSERRPRSSKIVPTAIEADFARTHSAVLSELTQLKSEVVSVHLQVEDALSEHHGRAAAEAEARMAASQEAAQKGEAAAQEAARAARETAEAVRRLQEAHDKRSCVVM